VQPDGAFWNGGNHRDAGRDVYRHFYHPNAVCGGGEAGRTFAAHFAYSGTRRAACLTDWG